MSALRSRAFEGAADLRAMHALIAAAWRVHGPRLTFHVGDLHWRMRPQAGRDPRRDVRLWHARSGDLAGFAWLDSADGGDLQCHPDAHRADLEPELLAWMEARARERGATSLTVGGFEGDAPREALLRRRGYRRQASSLHHTRRPLDAPVEPPALPEGDAVRPTRPGDLPGLALAVASAFGTKPRPTATYEALRAGPAYRNDLDWIAVTPDGRVAAFCLAWLDAENRTGLLEPVGCHADHQRRGLGRAVVAAALGALRDAGARAAYACPPSASPPARSLYAACGFVDVARDDDWTLRFEPAG